MIDANLLLDFFLGKVPNRHKIPRKAARGFYNFYHDFYTEVQTHKQINSYLELGIAGGNAHEMIAYCSSPDTKIFGVERFHPSMTDIPTYESEISGYNNFKRLVTDIYPNVTALHGVSAYESETVGKLQEVSGLEKYDIIVDDAATDWPRMRNSLNVWRDSVGLAFMTEVPDGMGVASWWAMSHQDHMDNYQLIAKDGLVIFNHEPDKIVLEGRERDFDSHYHGLWMPDWNLARNTIEKYRDRIVAGEENIVYDA